MWEMVYLEQTIYTLLCVPSWEMLCLEQTIYTLLCVPSWEMLCLEQTIYTPLCVPSWEMLYLEQIIYTLLCVPSWEMLYLEQTIYTLLCTFGDTSCCEDTKPLLGHLKTYNLLSSVFCKHLFLKLFKTWYYWTSSCREPGVQKKRNRVKFGGIGPGVIKEGTESKGDGTLEMNMDSSL